MEEISELIIELLKSHNRVSLPGMGAFMANSQSATIDKENKVLTPPSKKITFSRSETWNDGLLEQLYAECRAITVEEARDRLRHVINDIRFELDATGKATLPGLGTLKQSQARDISFGLNKNLNLKGDSYGLEEVKITSANEGDKVMGGKKKLNKNIPLLVLLIVMVVIVSALALFLLLSYSGNNDDLLLPSSPANVEVVQPAPASVPASATTQAPQEPVANQPAPAALQPAKVQPAPKSQAAKPQSAPASSRCEYCIVAASFNTHEGARLKSEKYKEKGYKAGVVDGGNGRFRVTIGCYPTRDAAKREQSNMQNLVKDAWILEVCK